MKRALLVLGLLAAIAVALGGWRREAAAPGLALPASRDVEADIELDGEVPLPQREIALQDRAGRVEPTTAAAAPAADPYDSERPLAERIAELDARARRGDAAAGCQLGFELLRCERARQLAAHAENVEAQVRGFRPPRDDEIDARIDAALRRRERHRQVRSLCEGVALRDWAEPARYLEPAARAGHIASTRQLLEENLYEPDALMRDPGLVALLRDNAPRWFRTLLERGDSGLLMRWNVARVQTGDPLLHVLPPPWNRPELAVAVMRQRIERERPPGDIAGPDDDPRELRDEAARIYERYFAPHAEADRRARERLAQAPFGDFSVLECRSLPGAQSASR